MGKTNQREKIKNQVARKGKKICFFFLKVNQ